MKSLKSIYFAEPLLSTEINVSNSTVFNKKMVSVDLERKADEEWNEKVNQNPRLFNGTKFRLDGWNVTRGQLETDLDMEIVLPDNGSTEFVMNVGFTSYKENVTSSLSRYSGELAKYGAEQYGDPQACMADVIANAGLVITSDNFALIQLRSHLVGDLQGLWHFPGGHAEPGEVGVRSEDDLETVGSDDIVGEVFGSLVREIKEEINITEEYLSDPRLLGICRYNTTFKPELHFVLFVKLTAREVSRLYHAEDFTDFESEDIGFWEVPQLDLTDKQTFDIHTFRGDSSEVISVSVDLLASCSIKLVEGVQKILSYNPDLFNV